MELTFMRNGAISKGSRQRLSTEGLKWCPRGRHTVPISEFYLVNGRPATACKRCQAVRYCAKNIGEFGLVFKSNGFISRASANELAARRQRWCPLCKQILNNLDYSIDNVAPCCNECNVARSDHFSIDEMKNFVGPAIREVKLVRMDVNAS